MSEAVNKSTVVVKGARGELVQALPRGINVSVENEEASVSFDHKLGGTVALAGTIRAITNNLVKGVTEGFTKKLELKGVGYRLAIEKASNNRQKVTLTLGKSHPDHYIAPEGIEFKSEAPTLLEIIGNCKQMVGQVAADIRSLRPPEPYKGKGIRYTDEKIILKETKKK